MSEHPVRIAPSLLAADFAHLAEEIRRVEDAGADLLHLDVMDGCFVPNISFGFPVIESVRRVTSLPLDVHLMIEDPLGYLPACRDAGADSVSIHVEARSGPEAALRRCRELELECGLVVNPDTPVEALFPHVREADLALVMSVRPGFGGQKFQPAALQRIARLRNLLDQGGCTVPIEVDGGINAETATQVRRAGATVLVAGSAVFGSADPAAAIRLLRG